MVLLTCMIVVWDDGLYLQIHEYFTATHFYMQTLIKVVTDGQVCFADGGFLHVNHMQSHQTAH